MVHTSKTMRGRLRMFAEIYLTRGLVKETDCNTKITEIENKIPSVTGLVNTSVIDTKATEIENKIPDITNQAAKASLNAKSRGGGS